MIENLYSFHLWNSNLKIIKIIRYYPNYLKLQLYYLFDYSLIVYFVYVDFIF